MLFDEDWIAPLEAAAKDHVRDNLDPRPDADVFASERPERGRGTGMIRSSSSRECWHSGSLKVISPVARETHAGDFAADLVNEERACAAH